MKRKKIYEALTEVRDEYIEEARTSKLKRYGPTWKKWTALAASLVIIGIGGSYLLKNLPFGGSQGPGGRGDTSQPGVFMSYAGPVLPLSLGDKDEDIVADRDLSYDFAFKDEDNIRTWGAMVEDSYWLTNTSSQDKTVKAIYPFVSNFKDLTRFMPKALLNGEEVEGNIYEGQFIGNSWQEYKDILGNEAYMEEAFTPYPILSQDVIVYRFADFLGHEEYDAATQAISFTIDPRKTNIFAYGFEGAKFGEGGFREFSYFVPHENMTDRQVKLLIIVGEDISAYELQGYKNGATEIGNELEGVSVSVTRQEGLMADVIKEVTYDLLNKYGEESSLEMFKERIYGGVSEFIYEKTNPHKKIEERYDYEVLEDVISHVVSLDRVFYLEVDLNIGGNTTASLIMDMYKDPNHDYSGSASGKEGVQGYDMATQLGSNLDFEKISAQLKSTENIEIYRDNFGFDLSQGITKVDLDPLKEYYYLEIRPLE